MPYAAVKQQWEQALFLKSSASTQDQKSSQLRYKFRVSVHKLLSFVFNDTHAKKDRNDTFLVCYYKKDELFSPKKLFIV